MGSFVDFWTFLVSSLTVDLQTFKFPQINTPILPELVYQNWSKNRKFDFVFPCIQPGCREIKNRNAQPQFIMKSEKPKSITDYIAGMPSKAQKHMEQIRALIKKIIQFRLRENINKVKNKPKKDD